MESFTAVSQHIQDIRQGYMSLLHENEQLKRENSMLQEGHKSLTAQNASYQKQVATMQLTIDNLEEERRQFTKVSSIIGIDKQNQVLKKEIEQLHEKLNKLLHAAEEAPAAPAAPAPAPATIEPVPDVFEKYIKGTIYYVSTENDMTIYKKNEDGSIGPKVGSFVKTAHDKVQPTWLC